MEEKREIVLEYHSPKFLDDMSQNRELTLSKDDLTQEDIDAINSLIELDLDPGFRTLESVLLDFGTYLANKKYFDPNATQPKHLRQKILTSNTELRRKQILYEQAKSSEIAYENAHDREQDPDSSPIKLSPLRLEPPILSSELKRDQESSHTDQENTSVEDEEEEEQETENLPEIVSQ